MGFKSFFEKISALGTKKVDISDSAFFEDIEGSISSQAYAMQVVVGLISALLSTCEVQTFQNHKKVKGSMWYLLNVKPNRNQNAPEFWAEFYRKLLIQGKAMVISLGDEIVCCDDWSETKYAVKEWEFSQVSKESFCFNKTWTISEVLYVRYSNGKVNQILGEILTNYNNLLIQTADRYKMVGGQKGTLDVTPAAQGTKDFEEKYKKLMNEYFRDFFKSRNSVLPLWGGMKYTPQASGDGKKATSEISDYSAAFADLISKAALAYNIAPALFKGDAAGLDEAVNQTLTTAIKPIAKIATAELNAKYYTSKDLENGTYCKICTNKIKNVNIFECAAGADKLFASGMLCTDELREEIEYEPIREDWARKHYITKNYEEVNKLGGEE